MIVDTSRKDKEFHKMLSFVKLVCGTFCLAMWAIPWFTYAHHNPDLTKNEGDECFAIIGQDEALNHP